MRQQNQMQNNALNLMNRARTSRSSIKYICFKFPRRENRFFFSPKKPSIIIHEMPNQRKDIKYYTSILRYTALYIAIDSYTTYI